MSNNDEQVKRSPGAKGAVAVIIALICAYSISMSNFKVAATIALIMQYFGVGPTIAGTAVTISGAVGLVVALFFGSAVTKWGARNVGIVTIGCALVGTVIGCFANSIELLLFSRVFEGFAFGTALTVVTPIITQWMPPQHRSIPMGFLGVWVGGGQFLISRAANLVFDSNDPSTWVNVWWFMAVLLVICVVLWLAFVHSPAPENSYAEAPKGQAPKLREGFNNPLVWCCLIMFFLVSAGLSAGVTFTQSYATMGLGQTAATANDWAMVRSITAIVVGIAAGLIMVKISSVKGRIIWIIGCMVVHLVAMAFTFTFPAEMAVPYMIVAGIATGANAPAVFSIAPDISKSPVLTSVTMGFIMVGQNLGNIFSGTMTGMFIEQMGYAGATSVITCYGIALIILSIVMFFLAKKRLGERFTAKAGANVE